MIIDEHIDDAGERVRTALVAEGERLRLVCDDGVHGYLPAAAIAAVMKRYGRPLEPGIELDGPRLPLGDGVALVHLRFHAVVDAEARDYLVYAADGDEPVAALSGGVASALRFLIVSRR